MFKLYPHQQKALDETKDSNKVAYYLDMGLGKTFVGSEKMNQIGSKVNLLICQKSKINDWVDHYETYYAAEYIGEETKKVIYNLTDKKQLDLFIGHVKDTSFVPGAIGIINYELAWRRPILKELEAFTLMLDESSLIQNEKAKQSKFILQLEPDNVILLSGTPTSGKYENLWSQINLLGWNISNDLYNRQYINWKTIEVGGFPMKIVDKENPYKNVDRLKYKLRQHGAIFMKTEEVMTLPEQTIIPIHIKTTKEYKKFQRTSIIALDQDTQLIGDTTLTKRLYSRMLCGQYNKEKLKAFEDLALSTQDRLIVFYNFNKELEELKKIANKLNKPISEVNGQVKDLDNYENEENSITLIQYQAGAMGLNLQKANKIIYFTLTEKSELFEQSKKRIHRIGQDNKCFYYVMICKNSIEEDIYETLKLRKDYTDELFREYERGNDHE